jgi:hypothetical protein
MIGAERMEPAHGVRDRLVNRVPQRSHGTDEGHPEDTIVAGRISDGPSHERRFADFFTPAQQGDAPFVSDVGQDQARRSQQFRIRKPSA